MTNFSKLFLGLMPGFFTLAVHAASIEVPINGTLQKISETAPAIVWNANGSFSGTFSWQSDIFAETAPHPSMNYVSSNYFRAYKYDNGDQHGTGRMSRTLAVDVSNWNPSKSYYVTVSQAVNYAAALNFGNNGPQDIAITMYIYCVGGVTLSNKLDFVDVFSMELTENTETAAFTVPPQNHCPTGLMQVKYEIQTMRAVKFKPLNIAISEIGS